jgi:Zn-finger protein
MKIFRDREKRLKAMSNGYIQKKTLRGVNLRCPWLPCHPRDLQDCTFCVCPFYPCHDESLGKWHHYVKDGAPAQVWDCSNCGLPHRKDMASALVENIADVTQHAENLAKFPIYKKQYCESTAP